MQNNETDPIVLENDSSFKTSTITKNQVLEKGDEKVSSVGKVTRLNDKTEAPTKPKTRTESRNKKYEKVVKIIGNLAPFMADINLIVTLLWPCTKSSYFLLPSKIYVSPCIEILQYIHSKSFICTASCHTSSILGFNPWIGSLCAR